MPDVFTIVIKKLQEMGAFNFLFPFMLTTAIFYGLLRKSKIFSLTHKVIDSSTQKEIEVEASTAVNAIIALVAGFMVWAYPILNGVNVEQQLSRFFMQGIMATLSVILILLIASLFMPPDLPKQLHEYLFKNNKIAASAIVIMSAVIAVIIFISSGFLNMIVSPIIAKINIENDTILTFVVLGLLILPLIFIIRGDSTPTSQN